MQGAKAAFLNYVEHEGLAKLTIQILALTCVGCLAYTWGYAEGIHNAHVVLPTTHVVSTHGFSFSSSGSGNATAVPYGASAAFGSSGGGDGGGGLPAEGQQPSMQSGSGGGGEREVDELDLPLRRLRSIFATAAMPRPR